MFFDVLLLSKMNRFSGEKRQTHENALSLSIICDRMTTNACDRLRFGSLFLHAVGCSLDDDSLLNVASPILKENANKSFNMVVDGPFLRLMNQCFRTEIDEQVDDPIQGVRFTSIVLHSWMELAAESDLSSFTLGLLITMECELSLHIPQGLTSFILAEHQSERFVRRAVETMTMMYQEGNDFRSRLLSSAILSDPREFVPVYCRIHDEKSLDDSYKNLFISGFLDTSLCASLDFVSGEINDITYLQSLGHQLNTRVEKSLDKSFEDPELCSLFTLIISMFPHSSLWTNLPSAPLVQLLSHLLSCEDDNSFRSVERFSESTISRALEVAAHVCDMGPQTTNLKMGQLKMTVSTFVCRSLPRVLRVSTDSCHRSFAIRLLSIFQSMVVRTISHAKNALNLTVRSSVTHCVRACLRFGMKEDGFGNSVVASSCLGAVKTFAKSLVADSLPLNIAASTSRNNMAAETFNMVTSHSQFDNIIQSRNNDDRKLEIVQILENCLLALPQVEFETAVWKSLLVGFTAGVTIIDNNVRLLLCMYGSHTKPVSIARSQEYDIFERF